MLKQVYVLKGNETLYSLDFGTGFSSEIFGQVKAILAPFINEPVDGMVFDRPLFNFQAIYVSLQGCFFLLVANLSDWPDDMKKEIAPLAEKFFNIMREIATDIKNAEKQEAFKRAIVEMYDRLYPKIVLLEPIESGEFTVLTSSYEDNEESLTITDSSGGKNPRN